MKLNGWQRIWITLSVLWSIYAIAILVSVLTDPSGYENRYGVTVSLALGYWVGPIIGVYVLGSTVAWIRKGFRRG